ncbi:hypothetical protein IB238_13000 [Rhizobium sp. ARZ01]|nr:hypothetical protein [Rhizobium sp. ARZ01]
MQHLRNGKSIWLALVAALFLVLQIANGAGAANQVALDAYGNPLCVNSSDHHTENTAPSSDHSGTLKCCTLACGAFADIAFSGRLTYAFERLLSGHSELIVTRADLQLRQLDEFQGSPRAPPRLS